MRSVVAENPGATATVRFAALSDADRYVRRAATFCMRSQ